MAELAAACSRNCDLMTGSIVCSLRIEPIAMPSIFFGFNPYSFDWLPQIRPILQWCSWELYGHCCGIYPVFCCR